MTVHGRSASAINNDQGMLHALVKQLARALNISAGVIVVQAVEQPVAIASSGSGLSAQQRLRSRRTSAQESASAPTDETTAILIFTVTLRPTAPDAADTLLASINEAAGVIRARTALVLDVSMDAVSVPEASVVPQATTAPPTPTPQTPTPTPSTADIAFVVGSTALLLAAVGWLRRRVVSRKKTHPAGGASRPRTRRVAPERKLENAAAAEAAEAAAAVAAEAAAAAAVFAARECRRRIVPADAAPSEAAEAAAVKAAEAAEEKSAGTHLALVRRIMLTRKQVLHQAELDSFARASLGMDSDAVEAMICNPGEREEFLAATQGMDEWTRRVYITVLSDTKGGHRAALLQATGGMDTSALRVAMQVVAPMRQAQRMMFVNAIKDMEIAIKEEYMQAISGIPAEERGSFVEATFGMYPATWRECINRLHQMTPTQRMAMLKACEGMSTADRTAYIMPVAAMEPEVRARFITATASMNSGTKHSMLEMMALSSGAERDTIVDCVAAAAGMSTTAQQVIIGALSAMGTQEGKAFVDAMLASTTDLQMQGQEIFMMTMAEMKEGAWRAAAESIVTMDKQEKDALVLSLQPMDLAARCRMLARMAVMAKAERALAIRAAAEVAACTQAASSAAASAAHAASSSATSAAHLALEAAAAAAAKRAREAGIVVQCARRSVMARRATGKKRAACAAAMAAAAAKAAAGRSARVVPPAIAASAVIAAHAASSSATSAAHLALQAAAAAAAIVMQCARRSVMARRVFAAQLRCLASSKAAAAAMAAAEHAAEAVNRMLGSFMAVAVNAAFGAAAEAATNARQAAAVSTAVSVARSQQLCMCCAGAAASMALCQCRKGYTFMCTCCEALRAAGDVCACRCSATTTRDRAATVRTHRVAEAYQHKLQQNLVNPTELPAVTGFGVSWSMDELKSLGITQGQVHGLREHLEAEIKKFRNSRRGRVTKSGHPSALPPSSSPKSPSPRRVTKSGHTSALSPSPSPKSPSPRPPPSSSPSRSPCPSLSPCPSPSHFPSPSLSNQTPPKMVELGDGLLTKPAVEQPGATHRLRRAALRGRDRFAEVCTAAATTPQSERAWTLQHLRAVAETEKEEPAETQSAEKQGVFGGIGPMVVASAAASMVSLQHGDPGGSGTAGGGGCSSDHGYGDALGHEVIKHSPKRSRGHQAWDL
jgi:hypothetical protein